jgi:hypothetical protein
MSEATMPKREMPEENRAPKPEDLDPAVVQQAKRRAAWRSGSEEKEIQARSDRIDYLDTRRDVVDETLDSYAALANPNAVVRLRAGGLYIEQPRPYPPSLGGPKLPKGTTRKDQKARDLRTRKPLARLVGLKGKGLSTYLSMVYALHAEGVTTDRHPLAAGVYAGDVPWSTLCGRQGGSPRARHARMQRDVNALVTARVARRRTDARQGEPGLSFLSDTGSGDAYELPEALDPNVIPLPASYFLNGWHLVLTQQEQLMLLTVYDAYARMMYDRFDWMENGVALTQHQRWSLYGVSGETYGTIHELEEFGLISIHDPMATRTKGKFTPPTDAERAEYEARGYAFSPVPYQLKPVANAFDRKALYAVGQTLANNPLPPRMHDIPLMEELLADLDAKQPAPGA